jgi:EAL domain-containing protein (putative c-di-GMP-specific phosphodiesterase class I)
MPVRPPLTPHLRLLVISQDQAWLHAATEAAARLGAELDVLPDVGQALHGLLHIDRLCTHVLASGPLELAQIDALAGMVDELTSMPTPLLLLGDATPSGAATIGVPQPNAQAIVDAIRADPCKPHPERPPLTGPALRAALHAGWLRMRFQPILAADTLAPVGLEALARLHHPTLGILHPSDFLPQAVEQGQERGFAGITAARTMLDLRALSQPGAPPVLRGLQFGLNVTVSVFCQAYAVERATQLCEVAAVDVRRVVIELVETPTLPDLALLTDAVQRWRMAGFGVAIDDAGPALPHWHALLPLGFSAIKLDGRLGGDEAFLGLAAEITEAAQAHGLYVVAEGIETEAALSRMRNIGVDAVQGFLFARPLPALAMPIWLKEWARRPYK